MHQISYKFGNLGGAAAVDVGAERIIKISKCYAKFVCTSNHKPAEHGWLLSEI